MNKVYELKVNGIFTPNVSEEAPVISAEELKFSWRTPEHLSQFTLQLSPMPNFLYVQYQRDTHSTAFLYDGPDLVSGRTYFWRIRSGVYPWVSGSFIVR